MRSAAALAVDNFLDVGRRALENGSRGSNRGLSALVEYVCSAHSHADEMGPLITIRDGGWAFCAGHGEDQHDWVRIEPTRREFVGDASQVQKLQAS
jgi:hypothetical protein